MHVFIILPEMLPEHFLWITSPVDLSQIPSYKETVPTDLGVGGSAKRNLGLSGLVAVSWGEILSWCHNQATASSQTTLEVE